MAASIRNCVFAYQCTRTWDSLDKTSHRDVRFCGDCGREVHFCHDARSLNKAIALNRCVAIAVPAEDGEAAGGMLLGDLAPPHDQG
jgi:hypothetical protein